MTAPLPAPPHLIAQAVIVMADRDADGHRAHAHYQIEWRGVAGTARSGVWYATSHAAHTMATECGAVDIVDEGTLR